MCLIVVSNRQNLPMNTVQRKKEYNVDIIELCDSTSISRGALDQHSSCQVDYGSPTHVVFNPRSSVPPDLAVKTEEKVGSIMITLFVFCSATEQRCT